jgi:hypothetical protein
MGRRLGASRKMPNLGDSERLENKEWLIDEEDSRKPSAANDPWSNENIAKNRERYLQNQQKFIDEHNRKRHKSYA